MSARVLWVVEAWNKHRKNYEPTNYVGFNRVDGRRELRLYRGIRPKVRCRLVRYVPEEGR